MIVDDFQPKAIKIDCEEKLNQIDQINEKKDVKFMKEYLTGEFEH